MANRGYERRQTHAPLQKRSGDVRTQPRREAHGQSRRVTKGEIAKKLGKLGMKAAFIGWLVGSLADNVVSYDNSTLSLAPRIPFTDKTLFKLPALTIKKPQTVAPLPPGARAPVASPQPPKVPTVNPRYTGSLHPKSCEDGIADPYEMYFAAEHTMNAQEIDDVLRQYKSPAVGTGQAFVEFGHAYGINPAFALAFFIHESSAGTRGMATHTHSVGNIRPTGEWVDAGGKVMNVDEEIEEFGASDSQYRYYDSWEHGIQDWYKLIRELYIEGFELDTVGEAVPTYAPKNDNNNPETYMREIAKMVCGWRDTYGSLPFAPTAAKPPETGDRKQNYTLLYSRPELSRRNTVFAARNKTS